MSEPTQTLPPMHGDPIAVILARMEVKLDQALAEQQRHSTILDRHDSILNEHGNRLTAVETGIHEIPARVVALEGRKYVSPATIYGALTILFIALGALGAIVGALHR